MVGLSENTGNAGDGGVENEETMDPQAREQQGSGGEQRSDERSSEARDERLFSQADVDRVVRDRLGRERKKFEGFEDFKKAAEQAGELQARNKELEEKLAGFERQGMVERIAEEHGVPATVLRGADEEELTTHAKELQSLFSQNTGDKPGGYAGVGVREAPPVGSAGKARVSEQQRFAQDLLRGR